MALLSFRITIVWFSLIGTAVYFIQSNYPLILENYSYTSVLQNESISQRSTGIIVNEDEPTHYTYNATLRKHADLPVWMDKYPFLPKEDDVPPENRICFVHIGKTAGSTLACYLGFLYPACQHRFRSITERLPAYTTSTLHRDFDSCRRTEIGHYLFTLRDPLARMQSWFTYERPPDRDAPYYQEKKPLFVECGYRTLNQLGEALNFESADLCQRRAWRAITGDRGYAIHNFYNYQFYVNAVPDGAKVLAIRTEHLERDWNSIEVDVLGGEPLAKDDTTFVKKNWSDKKDEDKYLSALARENLCRGLCKEIQAYKRLLRDAANLSDGDVRQSMTELAANCPHEAGIDDCGPDFDRPPSAPTKKRKATSAAKKHQRQQQQHHSETEQSGY